MEDVWFNSRIEAEDRYHDLDHASGEIPEEIQSRGAAQEGGETVAVYQILAGAAVVGWDLSVMDQEGEQGDGIARVECGFVVIVSETEEGERVEIEIETVRPNVAFAEVTERVS